HATLIAGLAVGAAVALVLGLLANAAGREGWAFAALAATTALAVGTLLAALFPDVMPSTSGVGGLTIENASSSDYTLQVMSWVALGISPIVLGYQVWTYWVFRKRVTRERILASAH
ncbi:MAG: cytochrome d ubiquinol oxidase subunit II, partial [Microbacteriaceae bacterium]